MGTALCVWVAVALVVFARVESVVATTDPEAPVAEATGRVVVGYRVGEVGAARGAVTRRGAAVVAERAEGRYLVVRPQLGQSAAALAQRLARSPGVRYAQPELVARALFTPNDPQYSSQSNLHAVGASSAWDIERGAPSVVVAVVDSGVDPGHPDLAGRVDAARGYDFIGRDPVANDAFGHGTHVAGVIAAATDNRRDVAGLAHRCTILPVRVLNAQGVGSDTAVADGIRHAVKQGADVINLSLGIADPSRVLEDAIEYAHARDVVIVAAAGNDGTPGLDYPAAYTDVVAVGALDTRGLRWVGSQYGAGLDLVAPGVNVLSLWPLSGPVAAASVGRITGTSAASPHVAGAAALLRSAHPSWPAGRVAARLRATAQDLGDPGPDIEYGHGLVRADLALSVPDDVTDDDLPGVPLPGSLATGALDAGDDVRDVFVVAVNGGHRLRVTLTGSSGALTEVRLIEPGSSSLDAPPVATASSTGMPTTLTYDAPSGQGGLHHLIVTVHEGSGEYRLAWQRGYGTQLTLSATPYPRWGGSASVRGRLLSIDDEPVPGMRVTLDARPSGVSAWKTGVASVRTGSDGAYRFSVHPTRKTEYRVRFAGAPGEMASSSRTAVVWPKAALAAPFPVSRVRGSGSYAFAGTLRPKHPAGARTVRVTVYRLDPGTGVWIEGATVRMVNRSRDGYTRYAGSIRLPRGKLRLVARVGGDDVHAPASATTLITVP